MGNCDKRCPSVTLIASDDTWIEQRDPATTTARLAGMRRVAGMPDHPGRGYPVGAAFFSTGRLYPALIGGDIGCGMSLWSTGIDARAATAKLEKRLGDIDGPLDDSWQPLMDELAPADVGHRQALGTIGGGNHFAELQRIDTVCDPQAVDAGAGSGPARPAGPQRVAWPGPRHPGRACPRHGHDGLAEDSADCQAYLARHDAACATPRPTGSWSLAACWTGSARKADSCWTCTQPGHARRRPGRTGLAAPQGATPSDGGLVVIPGSRGDFSYLVAPAPSAASLYSLAHGARPQVDAQRVQDRLSSATARAARQDPAGQPRHLRGQAADLRRSAKPSRWTASSPAWNRPAC